MDYREKPFDEFAAMMELYQKAEERFNAKEKKAPLAPDELYAYADIKRKLGKLDEAVSLFSACHALDKDNLRAAHLARSLKGESAGNNAWPNAKFFHRPAPLVRIPNFLAAEEKNAIHDYFLANEAQFTGAKYGDGIYDPEVRNNLELPGRHDYKSLFREKIDAVLPDIFLRLDMAAFPIKKIEVKFRAYGDGHRFSIHSDAGWGRRVTFTYYFYKQAKAYNGGDLVVFDTSADGTSYSGDFTRLIPEDNCLSCFPSFYFHAVLPVKTSSEDFSSARFTINGHISESTE